VWRLLLFLNKCFRAVVEPLARLSPMVALLVISMVTGVLLLLIFGATSNQGAIRRTKDKIKAHLLEILLFNDNLGVVFRAQGSIFVYAMKYLGLAVVPMLAIIVPMALIVTQSDHFFKSRPLKPNDTVTVSATLVEWDPELAEAISIIVPNGLAVETEALRIPETREVVWKLRALEYGDFDVLINTAGGTLRKRLIVSDSARCLSHAKTKPTFVGALVHSAEPPLGRDAPIESIEVQYAPARMKLGPIRAHWLVHFFILAMVFALIFKPVLKVEI
jgi:uncharacterized membrane protein (DUF106 family)